MTKRAFDIISSALAIIVFSPLLIIIAILLKSTSQGPVFFQQERVGKDFRNFVILKFRTMKTNHKGNSISIKGEDRITPIGAVLRKYKLDELPELWNVLIGNMSMVGPRPDMPEYIGKLKGEERLIMKMRPGITSPASLKYANEEEVLSTVKDPLQYNDEIIWPDKVRLNLDYYYNHNFWWDIRIIFRTIFR